MNGLIEKEHYDLTRVKFLVIDKNRFMRHIIRQVLHAFGTRYVQEAEDSGNALKMMQTYQPDIVTIDYDLAPLTGIEFIRMVRSDKHSPNRFVPIIMITGHSNERVIKEARDAGVTEFLTKPISAQGLYSRVISVIARTRPFVKAPTFFGPDRRRKKDVEFNGQEKRHLPESGKGTEDA